MNTQYVVMADLEEEAEELTPLSEEIPSGVRAKVVWFLTSERETVVFAREAMAMVVGAILIGQLLFAFTGVWPPFVAVTSSSMEPHVNEGDLILVMETGKHVGDGSTTPTGVVTHNSGTQTGYDRFGDHGDVIVYQADGSGHMIIHRARFWVEKGENWYDRANPRYLNGADDCDELRYCPAPHSGFITKGDSNNYYDQIGKRPISAPVKPEWIRAKAHFRIPFLGHLRAATIVTPDRTSSVTPLASASGDARRRESPACGKPPYCLSDRSRTHAHPRWQPAGHHSFNDRVHTGITNRLIE